MALKNEQRIVYEWLGERLRLPVFAEAYRGAVTLLVEKSPGYISFVSHAGRDLMNGLASTVAGIKSTRVQYQTHIDRLLSDWKDEWRQSDELSPEVAANGHLIPVLVCQKITALIEEHKSGRLKSSDANGLFFSTFLDYSDRGKIPTNFLSEWKTAKDWFLGHTHLREKPYSARTKDELEKHFKCLDGYLYIAASSQYDRLRGLDEILDATNL